MYNANLQRKMLLKTVKYILTKKGYMSLVLFFFKRIEGCTGNNHRRIKKNVHVQDGGRDTECVFMHHARGKDREE